jgi:hypothetical protein
MPLSNTSARCERAGRRRTALVSALLLAGLGCSGSPQPAPDAGPGDAGPPAFSGCSAAFSGDYEDSSSTHGSCSSLVPSPDAAADAGPSWLLQLQANSPAVQGQLSVTVDLGPTPGPGTFGSATVSSWSAVITTSVGCLISAGSQATSQGSLQLTLTDVSGLASGMGTAHGSLRVQGYVKASEGTDCGPSNQETAEVSF